MKRPPAWVWIVALALLPRLAWVLLQWSRGGPAFPYPDEQLHWDLAHNLVTRGELVSADGRYVARMPGYPLYLALFAPLGEGGVLLARLGQALLGALTAGLAARIAGRAFGRRAGLLAGVLVALDPFGIFFANLLLTEVLFTLLAVLLIGRWLDHLNGARQGTAAFLLTGLLCAAALFVRPAGAAWLGLAMLATMLPAGSAWQRVRRFGLQAAPILLLLVPWGLRNHAVVGSYAWLSANGGVTLYDAQGPQADGSSNQAFLRDERWTGLGEIERDRLLYAAAREEMRRDPGRVLELAWVKFKRTWSLFPNVAEHARGATAWASAVYTGGVLLLALLGGFRLLRTDRTTLVTLLLPVVVFTVLHCVFIGSVRYRIPLMPLLVLLGSGAVRSPAPPRISIE